MKIHIVVAAILITTCVILTQRGNELKHHLDLIENLTSIVTAHDIRLDSIENRPEIVIENANVFSTEDEIVIQGD